MPEKPPFYSQTYEFSCVPACLRMVLAGWGCEVTEAELRARCECDETGTTPGNAVRAARHLGFAGTFRANLAQLEELQEELARGLFPIVFLRLPPGVTHAVVVTAITASECVLLDPALGERSLASQDFTQQWQAKNGLTILVE